MITKKPPSHPEMLRAGLASSDNAIGVDRENNVLRGYVVAESGHFKSEGRGQFNADSLAKIVELGNAAKSGLRSRFSHPNMSDDGLGKYLGRSKNYRIDGDKVRADLHFDKTALQTPPGGGRPYGEYIMDLAENDPGALGSSLVLKPERIKQEGENQPDLWMPVALQASDIVDEGDATHGDLLSVDGLDAFLEGSDRRLPSKLAVVGAQYLDQLFPDSDREVIESRFSGFLENYLSKRFGAATLEEPKPLESLQVDEETKAALAATNEKLSALATLIETDRVERKAELSAAQRQSKIVMLCSMAGCSTDAPGYVANQALSADDVRDQLFAKVCTRNAPASDDPASEQGLSKVDENKKFRDEFAAQKATHDRLGISEERYIKRRRTEEGLPATAAA